MKKDDFGDRMKRYEEHTNTKLNYNIPVYARLDGRSFSKFTKSLSRPFDERFSHIMVEVTKELVKQFQCDIAFTQSDEISIGWGYRKTELGVPNSGEFPIFSGRIQKLASILAATATAKFNQLCIEAGGELRYLAFEKLPVFDCRICQPYDYLGDYQNTELINMFVWRSHDIQRNSVSMAAQSEFSHKELQGKGRVEMKDMLLYKGIDFQTHYPNAFRRGTYVQRVPVIKVNRETGEEIQRTSIEVVDETWTNTTEMYQYWFPDKA